jgi:predicted DNA binding CopG/RHH family protein
MSKKLPVFKTDREAETFLDQDLSDYLSAENFAPFQFEFKPKQKSVNLRISEELLNAVRAVAHRRGIPYQRYIRQTLEASLRPLNESRSGKGRAHRSSK